MDAPVLIDLILCFQNPTSHLEGRCVDEVYHSSYVVFVRTCNILFVWYTTVISADVSETAS